MVALGGTYQADPDNVGGDYTPVPPGEYRVIVKDSDMKENSRRNGTYLQLDLEIVEGEHAGRTIIERLNLDNPNQQAVDIAQRTLNAICVATGKMAIADSNELHNIPMIAVVKVDPAKPYMKDGVEQLGSPSNSVKTYKPVGQASASAPAAQTAAAGGSAPPWKRNAA
ncbi:DUF669 domain-containing protein [Erythrobacter sp. SCSIO 43205]|uniref:DUF669 domain-containing protein n=1 Tax=Erythrobacter sp. SCSIO 43205 TaxID=2779361 RepID=UPI001CA8439F|nr:DUF669 domain-containing protein [Erythrobacter sp. SCSIO 43205]UAB76986.1 DUF669 domain-containing protein [Erythrobacter sp. SCSIO 43205]